MGEPANRCSARRRSRPIELARMSTFNLILAHIEPALSTTVVLQADPADAVGFAGNHWIELGALIRPARERAQSESRVAQWPPHKGSQWAK